MKTKKSRRPTHRPPVTDVEKHWLFGVAIRDSKIFDETARHITDEHFGECESWLSLVWRVVRRHHAETGQLPGKRLIFTLCNAERQLNPEVVSDEGAAEITKFVNTAFNFTDEDMPQTLLLDCFRRFLEDRLMDQAHEALGHPQTPLLLADVFDRLSTEAGQAAAVGRGTALPDDLEVIVYPPDRGGYCRVVARRVETSHEDMFRPLDHFKRKQFCEEAISHLHLSPQSCSELGARILSDARKGVADHTTIALSQPDNIQMRPVDWLWRPYVPYGAVTIIEGRAEMGKSLIGLDLAARLSRGADMPLTDRIYHQRRRPQVHPVASLVLTTEDSLETTVYPRLTAAGANFDYVRCITNVQVAGEPKLTAQLPSDIPALERTIVEIGARLLVIDVLSCHLDDGYDLNRDADMRRLLTPLAQMTDRTGVAVVFGRHPNKKQGLAALDRGTGSTAIAAAARSVLLIARHPDEPERNVMAIVKANLVARDKRESMTFRLVSHRVEGIPASDSPPRLEWCGRSLLTADQLWEAEGSRGPTKLDQAKSIITQMMAAGRRCATETLAACQTAGISERTYYQARRELGVISDRSGFGPGGSHRLRLASDRQPQRDGP